MNDYKQYRADFAKLAWVAALTTTHDSKDAAQKAVSWADDFIAELERTDARAQATHTWDFSYNGQTVSIPVVVEPQPEPPAPARAGR